LKAGLHLTLQRLNEEYTISQEVRGWNVWYSLPSRVSFLDRIGKAQVQLRSFMADKVN
jgi:hypothetical protein